MKLTCLVRSLELGGTERQLVTLTKGLRQRGHQVSVLVFYRGGALEPALAEAGASVIHLGKAGRWDIVGFLWRTYRAVRREQADILYSFLPTANIVAALIGTLAPGLRVVWGLRAAVVDLAGYSWLTRLSYRLERTLAGLPRLITVNSHAAYDHHARLGYPVDKMVVIPNGIDSHRFGPDTEAGRRLRRKWGIGPDERLIGLVARIDPLKDHATFLRALAIALNDRQDLRAVCIGDGPAAHRRCLLALADDLNLNGRVIWAGACDDMPPAYNAFDIATSSSCSESFSNAIGEAMACGVPCVVTDVGDSALIVGETGLTVAPRDPAALAESWSRLLELPDEARAEMGLRARQRICERFSVEILSENVDRTLRELLR